MDWTLERVNVPRSFVVLSNDEQSYTCGRCAESKIICPSLVVSRRHCIFLRVGDTLSVIDLKSSNGVFLNNKLIDPDLLVPLKENDVIGIGCAELYRENEPMYVYKLHKGNLSTRNLENFDELLTQRRPESSVVAAVSLVDKNIREYENKKLCMKEKDKTKLGTKRNLNGVELKDDETGNVDDCEPPPFKKANRIVGRKEGRVSDKNANLLENCVKEKEILIRGLEEEEEKKDDDKEEEEEEEEEEEIQEIWSTMNSADLKMKEKITSEVSTSSKKFSINVDPESNVKDKRLNRRLTLDLKEKEKEKGKEEDKIKKKINKTDEDDNKKSLIKNNKNNESKKKLSKNVEKKNLKKRRGKNIKIITETKGSNDNEDKIKKKNIIIDKLSPKKDIVSSFSESNDKLISTAVVKLENIDPMIGKNVEEKGDFSSNEKKDRNSFISKEPNATSSPFKLKMMKQEPSTSFSIVDTVDLSDDDEDIFPSSQLFDSIIETDKESTKLSNNNLNDDFRIKIEEDIDIKEENLYDDYNNRDNDYDYKDVIIISDNEEEDEDNRWLIRLSESQRIKDEDPEINETIEFFDEMMKVKEDLDNLIEKSEIPNLHKDKDEVKDKIEPKSLKILSITEIEKELFENFDSIDSTDAVAEKIIPLQSEDKKSAQSLIDKKISSSNKGPEIIEPLPLPQKKRRSMEEKIGENSVLESPSTSTSKSKSKTTIKDCVVRVSKLPNNLTLKEKRNLQLKDKFEEKKYEDEQRLRRFRNKWTQNVPLPIGKRKISLPITKKQKLDIVNERKEKLKALAQKPKDRDSAGPSNVERVAAKPKAKVSLKSRGDFLIDQSLIKDIENAGGKKKDSRTKKMDKKSFPNDDVDDGNDNNRLEIPRNENDDEDYRVHDDDGDGNKAGTSKSNFSDKRDKKIRESRSNDTLSLTQKENRVPNLFNKDKNLTVSKKDGVKIIKRVTFRDDLNTVREFEIEPNNSLKKVVGKDALIPKEKLPTTRKIVSKEGISKIEEFLRFIFMWNPSWLDEQKRLKSEPPIVGNDVLVPLLTNYKSYKDYYQVMIPLFLVELWHVITKEFDNIENRCETVFCSVVTNSVTSVKIKNSNTTLTTMMLEMIASNDDIRRQKHPDNGNLVFLELCYRNNEEKLMFLKVFAYVTYVHRSNITPNSFFNRELTNYVKNPSYVLTYTILTKPLKVTCCENRVLRLRRVTYLRSNLRTVQALQSLPNSPLMNAIVDPRVEQYQLSQSSNKRQSSLFTGDKLNGKQLEAVLKITETIVKKEAKICLVQGPPGTGKSHVIVNLVMQTLYGENRYKNREQTLRILLCAPSNAAIDEIVLRLLDRRAKLTNDRFKMVRVGISNSMHPRVRDISVEELAKRDLKKTIKGYQSSLGQSMDSVEEEKRFIEARINALQSQITNTHKKDDSQTQYLRTKLLDMRAKYDLIKNCIQSSGNNIDTQTVAKQQRSIETKILHRADIIACTLSSCYTNLMESTFGGNENCISVCIVDEATQSCEADTLIPLMLGVNTLVLVGDPAQLPATIISQRAKKLGLDQSLFSRIQRSFEFEKNNPVIMLDVQYRMDPSISYWPNKYFYGGKLRDAYNRKDNNITTGSSSSSFPLKPYTVLDIDTVQNSDKFSNNAEADFVVNLIKGIIEHFDEKKIHLNNFSIGVITPYRKQQILVQEKMNERVLPMINNHLKGKIITQVNTVDSFQGHERDLIIMSCVRTNGIGFMSDRQRLCVALTRAKSCLILCGNFATFQRDAMWGALLLDANFRKKYIRIRSNAKPNEIISNLVK